MRKLDEDMRGRVVDLISKGIAEGRAAEAVGINPKTLSRWINRPANGEQRELSRQVARARIEGKAALIKVIEDASAKDWKAAAWLLERKYPAEFARPAPRVIGEDGARRTDETVKLFIAQLGLK